MRRTRVFLFLSIKNPKNNGLPRKQKKRTMTKMVPSAKSGDYKIQYMLPVACDYTVKGKCTTATTKSDSFDKKTQNLSAPF